MENLWSDREAEAAVRRYRAEGVGRDLALRVYTTRLLGGEPRLVLHGGGNTSLKTRMADLAGDEVEVLRVKGVGAGTWRGSSRRGCLRSGWSRSGG